MSPAFVARRGATPMLLLGALYAPRALERRGDHFVSTAVGDRGVDLSGVGRAVSKQVLHDTKIGFALQHMGGEGMTQQVGVNRLRDASLQPVVASNALNRACGEPSPGAVQEQRGLDVLNKAGACFV